jgi:hypothetical protein
MNALFDKRLTDNLMY